MEHKWVGPAKDNIRRAIRNKDRLGGFNCVKFIRIIDNWDKLPGNALKRGL